MENLIRRSPEEFYRLYRDSGDVGKRYVRRDPCSACEPGEWELDCKTEDQTAHIHNKGCWRRIQCTQDIDVLRKRDRALYGGIVP